MQERQKHWLMKYRKVFSSFIKRKNIFLWLASGNQVDRAIAFLGFIFEDFLIEINITFYMHFLL